MAVDAQWIIEAMEHFAPRHLAEDWDNVGLVIGHPRCKVTKVLVALDVTMPVAQYAAEHHYNLIICHHPPIFKPLTALRTDTRQGEILALLLRHSIAVYTAHTNLDIAAGGVNDVLAAKLGLRDVQPLHTTYEDKLLKLVVFVPLTHAEAVREAICQAGAGHIGQYSCCTFQTAGTGTFLPLPGTRPFLGQQGQLAFASEVRLETIVPQSRLQAVVQAMMAAHPYEEVAYDLYQVVNSGYKHGLGRIGHLPETCNFNSWIEQVKSALGISVLKAAGPVEKDVRIIAVCGGSGASLISDAVVAGADVLITGDVKYHEAQQAADKGLIVIDAGHFATEQPVLSAVTDYLRQYAASTGQQLIIDQDSVGTDIFQFI